MWTTCHSLGFSPLLFLDSMKTVHLLDFSLLLGFPCGSAAKESACNARDLGSIPGLERSPGEGKGYPLQYSGLETSMDCIVHGVAKSRTRLSDFHTFPSPWLHCDIPEGPIQAMLLSHPSTEHRARHMQGSKDRNNTQQAEATKQPSVDEKDKENGVYSYRGIWFSLKIEGNPVICNNRDEPKDLMLKEISQAPGLLSPFTWGILNNQTLRK